MTNNNDSGLNDDGEDEPYDDDELVVTEEEYVSKTGEYQIGKSVWQLTPLYLELQDGVTRYRHRMQADEMEELAEALLQAVERHREREGERE